MPPADDHAALVAALAGAGCVAADEEAAELAAAAGGDAGRLDALAQRRLEGEPLAWIVGHVSFCGIEVVVEPGVYVPRWQTEPLATRAAARLPETGVAVDVCAGAGAVAATLRARRPRARVLATDIDERAVACARRNGVEAYAGDMTDPVPTELVGTVDVVVAVPPYVPTAALRLLPRGTFAFESPLAYDGGADGADLLRRIALDAVALLRPGGALLLELGGDQADVLASELAAAGYIDVETLVDEDGDVRGVEVTHGGAGVTGGAAGVHRVGYGDMGLRIFTEPQQGASYEQLLAVARVGEECGYEAFFRSDHYLKMGSADGLPAYTDAWTTLAGLARDTTTIRLGTLVTPTTFRAIGTFPVVVAQVDHMSGGRVDVGLGAGWYEQEHKDYGLPFPPTRSRFDLLEDQLAILHGVWGAGPDETFERKGLTCDVRVEVEPLRPAQRPHPPIIVGGHGGRRGARLAATYCDEFNVSFIPPEEMREVHDAVRRACEERQRDPASVIWSVGQVLCCGADEREVSRRAAAIGREVDQLRRNGLAGSPAEVLDKIGAVLDAGAQRFYLQVLDLSDLDHLRLVADEVLAHLPTG